MADYDALGKALEAVKHTLERLLSKKVVICFFECGIASSSNFVLGFDKGFLRDARSLRAARYGETGKSHDRSECNIT